MQEITGTRISGPIVFEPSVDLTRGPGRLLCESILAIKTKIEHQEAGSENDLHLSILEDALISAILNLPGSHSRQSEDAPVPSVGPWVVRRAEELFALGVGGVGRQAVAVAYDLHVEDWMAPGGKPA